MSSVFHSTVNDIIPWQSHYSFPSMATKAHKQTVKLRPTKGGVYRENQTLEIDFPSDGYLNMLNSVLSFKLKITPVGKVVEAGVVYSTGAGLTAVLTSGSDRVTANAYVGYVVIFANNKQVATITAHAASGAVTFNKPVPSTAGTVTLIPGISLPPGGAHEIFKRIKTTYGSLVLEDSQRYDESTRIMFDTGVSENFLATAGNICEGTSASFSQESAFSSDLNVVTMTGHESAVLSLYNNGSWTKRICMNLLCGTTTLKKLLPLKWMAAQFRIHMELNSGAKALLQAGGPVANSSAPVFEIDDVHFIAELMDFDSTYDTAFFAALQTNGVPLRFPALHYHSFNLSGAQAHLSVHERARSVKWAIAVIVDEIVGVHKDCNAFSINPLYQASKFADDGTLASQTTNHVEEFQWRIGGKYYPAQPVLCTDGGAEAYIELLKLNGALGDYTFNTNMSQDSWGNPLTSNKFMMACKFENDDVFPDTMSGINAEEQSDLSLMIKFSGGGSIANRRCDIFIGYESLIIVKEGNNVELVL